MVHIAAAAGYAAFQNIRNRWSNPLLQISTVVVPVILLGFFHYETGMFNRMIFHGFLDDVAVHLDKAIFGCQPYLFLREKMPFEWAAQFFHASYAGFYLLLVGPLMILYFKEVGKHAVYHTPAEFWQRASRVQEMLFVLMFTMLACYLVAVIIPMKGPTEHHAALFPEPRGMVAVMNYLFANGDLDGGAMPSSHVAGALVVIIYSFKYLKGWFWAALGLFVPLTLSTVYNSYHYATDIIAGLAAGWLFYSIGKRAFMFVASCRPAAR
ncbi:MAG: phosphatase PAP2 family protein [Chitinispirillaceae bacterium]|nr:phosphatase PAP2 family protein [Chitinispirillaceae bacterium]